MIRRLPMVGCLALVLALGLVRQDTRAHEYGHNHDAVGVSYQLHADFTGAGVIVGMMDTSISSSHSDLLGRVTMLPVYGSAARQGYWHGTAVGAGIAGRRDGQKVVGIAPGVARLYGVDIFAESDWDGGYEGYAALRAQGVKVVNFSAAWSGPEQTNYHELLAISQYRNSFVVVRGSSNSGAHAVVGTVVGNPSVLLSNFLYVGGLGRNGQLLRRPPVVASRPGPGCFSDGRPCSFLPEQNRMKYFWVCAPSEDIPVADSFSNGVTSASGSSHAAFHVTGVIALLHEKAARLRRTLTPAQAVQIVKKTAVDIFAPGVDEDCGHGLVNATRALAAVESSF